MSVSVWYSYLLKMDYICQKNKKQTIMTKYRIHLSELERSILLERVTKGKHTSQHVKYAHILLSSDENTIRKSETEISSQYHLSTKTVERVRKLFCEQGMEIFIKKPNKTRSDKKFDARVESHLISLCCTERSSDAPKWTLKMLADKLVELEIVESITPMSVSNLLKKTNLSPFNKKVG